MRHNSVVSGHPKSTRIPRIDGLSTGSLDLGHHNQSNFIECYENFIVKGRNACYH